MAEADTGNISIIVAIVAGLCSLLGAFAGAALSRKSDHIKWLRDNKSEVFKVFFEKIQLAKQKTFEARIKHTENGTDSSMDMIEAFSDVRGYERIVRLYLQDKHRDEFADLVNRYWKWSASGGKFEPANLDGKACLNRVQEIFEIELKG